MSNLPPGVTEANLPGCSGDLYELDVDYSDDAPAPGEWRCETCDAGIGWQEVAHDTYDYDEVKWITVWVRPDDLLICDDCESEIRQIEDRAQAEIDRSEP
jgi:hypothetical protein